MAATLRFRKFEGMFKSWDTLFGEATSFATELGRERVVNISHSSDSSAGLVVVWYWTEAGELPGALSPAEGGSGGSLSST